MKDLILHLRPKFTNEEKEKSLSVIENVIRYATIARNYGLLAFEPENENEESVFVKYIIRMIVDGVNKYYINESVQHLILADNYKGTKLLNQLLYARGFLCILDGDNPRVIKETLYAMLGEKYLKKYFDEVSEPSLKTANEILKEIYESKKDKHVSPECAGFEKELLQLNRIEIQRLIREIDYRTWAVALYGCSPKLINDHFGKLNKGEQVIVPHFSFRKQERDPGREMLLKLGQDELVVFEGIHALNDLLADEHPDAFKLYVSARSDILHDNGELAFKRTWTRLLRRVVRDDFFRAMGAVKTLEMWGNVREGEKKYISPFKYKADVLFDTSMEYEVPVMKQFALNAFNNIPNDIERSEELHTLLPALKEFEEIDASLVADDSILREFIGGVTYTY